MQRNAENKLAYSIKDAIQISGLGRTFLYERIACGDLKSVKVGGRRLILHTDLVAFLTGGESACTTTNQELPLIAFLKALDQPK